MPAAFFNIDRRKRSTTYRKVVQNVSETLDRGVVLYSHPRLEELQNLKICTKFIDRSFRQNLVEGVPAWLVIDISGEGPRYKKVYSKSFLTLSRLTGVPAENIILTQTNRSFQRDMDAHRDVDQNVPRIGFAYFYHFPFSLALNAKKQRLWEIGHQNIEDGVDGRRMHLVMNARPRRHRIALLYHLIQSSERDDCYITFRRDAPGDLSFEKVLAQPYMQRFAQSLSTDIPSIRHAIMNHSFDPSSAGNTIGGQLAKGVDAELYRQTVMSVIAETEMTSNGRIVRYTEKVIKPLLMGHPMVVFGNRNTIKQVKTLGFDTFDDLIDHSYDAQANGEQRFKMAFAEVDRLLREKNKAVWRTPAIKERLHQNVSKFEGEYLAQQRQRARRSLLDALGMTQGKSA